MPRRNPNDLTKRNLDAAKKRHAAVVALVKLLEAAQRNILSVVQNTIRIVRRLATRVV